VLKLSFIRGWLSTILHIKIQSFFQVLLEYVPFQRSKSMMAKRMRKLVHDESRENIN
jgi:hypothetical protein